MFIPTAPIGLTAPTVSSTSASSLQLQWQHPSQPNGVVTHFLLLRRQPSILSSPSQRDLGVVFYGTDYALFNPSASLSGFTTSVSLWFRTEQPNGVLTYSITASSTDFMALELRGGVPWFLFDAGSGPAAIRPATSVTFDDGRWHTLTASRTGRDGQIVVDGVHSGQGSSLGSDQFIGAPSVFYIGGLPNGTPLSSSMGTLNPNATLTGASFTGCLFRVVFNEDELDFSTQINQNSGVGPAAGGCPIDLERGVSFVGGGYLQLSPLTFSPGSNFALSLNFRTTDPSGILLFAYGDSSHILLELRNSSLVLRVKGNNTAEHILTSSTSGQLCDRQWHQLQVSRESDAVLMFVDGQSSAAGVNDLNLALTSSTFLGGIPSSALNMFMTLTGRGQVEFSGCLRGFIVNGEMVDMYGSRENSWLVRYGGCENSTRTADSSPECVRADIESNTGLSTSYVDGQLAPFTGELVAAFLSCSSIPDPSSFRIPLPCLCTQLCRESYQQLDSCHDNRLRY